ncbi:MAG: hypothetical protein ACP5SI_11830 [Chloroflexia bacterium]
MEQGKRLPFATAAFLLSLGVICVWTLWGVAELFHEGWYGPWPQRLLYFVPAALWLALTYVGLSWPRTGGWSFVALVGGSAVVWNLAELSRGQWSAIGALNSFPVSGIGIVIGLLFLL